MARKQAAKAVRETVPSTKSGALGQVAELIGASLADLLNRKEALARQLADVDLQIASARRLVTARVADTLPRLAGLGRRKTAGTARRVAKTTPARKGNGKRKRPLPPDEPLVTVTERARSADAKGRAARRARASRRSGNR